MINDNQLTTSALGNLNITELNKMQEAALEGIATSNSTILLSPTGSGKSVAFLLPLIHIIDRQKPTIQALILTPSRELALQIESVLRKMAPDVRSCCCYGGHPIAEEKRSIQGNKPMVIIGTPGRVKDHIEKYNFDARTIETLIIDEFDKSLEFGFHDQMLDIISQLSSLSRRVLLSATDAKELPEFAEADNTLRIDFLDPHNTATRLISKRVISPSRDKVETLYRLLCSLGSSSSIVFCNHRESVDRVVAYLRDRGLDCEAFHGGMEQPDRERALYKYRNCSSHVMVATDLAARGLDIPEVEHVVHYHLPPQEEPFTHRNGRTARWESSGTSYILSCEGETLPAFIPSDIELHTLPEKTPQPPKPLWETLYIGRGKKDKLSKMDVAGFLYKKGGLTRDDVGVIDLREHYGFVAVRRNKLKSLLTNIRGEKIKGARVLIEVAR